MLEQLAAQLGVTGLKERERERERGRERDAIKEVMTKFHPNDQAFVDLVHQVWSRKQNEVAQPKKNLFKSDLGNDVDQDVLEYIDEERKKEFNQVREAAMRRIKERAATLHDRIVEARAKHEPKKRKRATKSDKNQKGSKRKPVPLSKKERKTKIAKIRSSVAQRFAKEPDDLQLIVICKLSLQWKHLLLSLEAPAAEPSHASTVPASSMSALLNQF